MGGGTNFTGRILNHRWRQFHDDLRDDARTGHRLDADAPVQLVDFHLGSDALHLDSRLWHRLDSSLTRSDGWDRILRGRSGW